MNKPRIRLLQACRELVTPERFAAHFLKASKPAHFKGLVKPGNDNPYGWPAVEAWSSKGAGGLEGMLNDETEHCVVPVEVNRPGQGYNSEHWQQLRMPFGIFLEGFVHKRIPWSASDGAPDLIGYMAQHDLLSSSPSLARQCPSLPHTKAGERGANEQWQCNTWIGPANSFTPIHRDPYHNMFVQVVGGKRVHLFPPDVQGLLRMQSKGAQTNTSTITTEEPLLEGSNDEEIARALEHPESCHAVLEGGDALYIPQGWLHCVRSLTTSASVNFWFR